MKKFCDICGFEGELIERVDGKWLHNSSRCVYGDGFESINKEGFCYYCGLKEKDGRTGFVKRKDGKNFHGDCANRSQ